jgi:mannosyltransferase
VALARVAGPQSAQVDWITVPPDALPRLLDDFAGAPGFLAASLVLLLLGREPAVWAVAGPWLVIPPATLLIASQWDPIYVYRYVLFSLPAMALLVAAGLDRFPWYLAWPSILVAGLLTLPSHEEVRDGGGRPDDISALASVIAEQKEPGDGLVFEHDNYRRVEGPFPKAYAGLRDVFLQTGAWTAGNLDGVGHARVRLVRCKRVVRCKRGARRKRTARSDEPEAGSAGATLRCCGAQLLESAIETRHRVVVFILDCLVERVELGVQPRGLVLVEFAGVLERNHD